MKKLILSVSLVLMSLSGYPQSGGFSSSPGSFDSSNNPSGVGFSGALGGANNSSNTTPASTTTPSSTVTPGPGATGTSTVPGSTLPQQQQEELGNFAGGSMGGQTDDRRFLPSNSSVPPTQPQPSNIPAATGVGTGAPTSY